MLRQVKDGIEFYVWNSDLKQLVRKRDYSVNQYHSIGEKRNFAKHQIKELNELLISGMHISESKAKEEKEKEEFTVKKAFDYVFKLKGQWVVIRPIMLIMD